MAQTAAQKVALAADQAAAGPNGALGAGAQARRDAYTQAHVARAGAGPWAGGRGARRRERVECVWRARVCVGAARGVCVGCVCGALTCGVCCGVNI